MKITQGNDGKWCATAKRADGTVCCGYDEFMSMAILYCWENLLNV